MSYLEYFPSFDPISNDAPAHFYYPSSRTFHMARGYIQFYEQHFGHISTNYTTGFTRKIQADNAADVEASFNELKNGQMVGAQDYGATNATSIFCLSYSSTKLEDGNYGLSREDWRRALAIAAKTGNTSVVLWVDILDRKNRSHPWGDEQLCPYLIYPVIFVATANSRVNSPATSASNQKTLRMWPAIEATMGQLGAGLITDRIAQYCGHFIPFQARSHGLYYSMTVSVGPKVEREAFDLHVASGRFRGCPTFHQGDYDKILRVLHLVIVRWQDEDGDFFPALERLELRFKGMQTMKLEVISTRWMTTELTGWTGRTEWFPQEGGLISGRPSVFVPGAINGAYEVYENNGWVYCVINRDGKKTLLRMYNMDGTLRPEKLRTNAYARIPAGKSITGLLGVILGIELVAKHDGTFDLSRVEWE